MKPTSTFTFVILSITLQAVAVECLTVLTSKVGHHHVKNRAVHHRHVSGHLCVMASSLQFPSEGTSEAAAPSTPLDFSSVIKARAINPGPSLQIKGKTINLVGLHFTFAVFAAALLFYPALAATWLWSKLFDAKRRRAVDWVVYAWAKTAMLLCFYHPKVTGLENLPSDRSEALLFIPNHTSFLDIFSLSGFVPWPLKYVSKIEILRVPLIGWAMRMASHIAIRRTDRRSQVETFRDTVDSLAAGNSVVTFAEGTRSPDGTLRAFKKGPFMMSGRTGVRVVPVSICDLHRWMPSSALLPLAFPRQVEIKIHPPIATKGRDENEVLEEVFRAIDAGLPDFQVRLLSA